MKVFVYAYLAGNFGDDLMVTILCKRYPKVQFEVLAAKEYKKTFEGIKNLKVYSPDDKKVEFWNKILNKTTHGQEDFFKRKVKKADALIHIGGSVFVQHDIWETLYANDLFLRESSKKMYVCGANFGPYKDEIYYKKYLNLFKRYNGICFRDQYSYQLFSELPQVRYAPDIVFNCSSADEIIKEKKQVLVSIIELRNREGNFPIKQYADDYESFMVQMIDRYIQCGYQIKVVSFCKGQEDQVAAKRIIEQLSEEKRNYIQEYSYDQKLEDIIRLFDESEVVIGTRFHSVILGWLKGKKVLPIVYDQKTLRVLEDFKSQVYVTLDQLKEANIEDLMKKIESFPVELLKDVIKQAEQQFEDLDELFQRRSEKEGKG